MPYCKVILLDECNCKVAGLEPSTIRKCVNALKFVLPHARHLPSVKLGRWDGTVAFFSVGYAFEFFDTSLLMRLKTSVHSVLACAKLKTINNNEHADKKVFFIVKF